MKFENVKLGQEFIYNGLVYTKKNINLAFNDKLGNFIIYPNEKVKPITDFNFIEFKERITPFIIPFITFTIGIIIGIIIFLVIN